MAVFPASQYLGDPRCQQFMRELCPKWKGHSPETDALIAQFHPLSMAEFKQATDIDAYFLQSMKGYFNRVHCVVKNKVPSLNPPPGDSLCESCQVKGWLRKEYRTSKVDGANAAVWLCPDCVKVDLTSKLKKLDDIESDLPRTNFPLLDENPKLLALLLDALPLAMTEVKRTGTMSPFAILETFSSQRMQQSFTADRLELAYEEAREAVLAAPVEVSRYALAWLGYVTVDGVRYEAILVGGGERGDGGRGAAIALRYKQHLPDVTFEAIGSLKVLGPHENVLGLAGDPGAVSKLRPVFTRITADMAHHHGPGHDEALTYEIRKCLAVYLDLGDLDRPFQKELQKEPDIVQVVMGRKMWVTFFRPEDKEVVLARDTLTPIGGAPPFPGFNDAGLIVVGYAPPISTLKKQEGPIRLDLVVLWVTTFRITDKEATDKPK
jgi:hypothetical protein